MSLPASPLRSCVAPSVNDDRCARATLSTDGQRMTDSARAELKCEGFVGDKLIMDGVAVVRVPRRRKPSAR